MVERVERMMVSLSVTPVELAVRLKFGWEVKQVPNGVRMGRVLNTVPHLRCQRKLKLCPMPKLDKN